MMNFTIITKQYIYIYVYNLILPKKTKKILILFCFEFWFKLPATKTEFERDIKKFKFQYIYIYIYVDVRMLPILARHGPPSNFKKAKVGDFQPMVITHCCNYKRRISRKKSLNLNS